MHIVGRSILRTAALVGLLGLIAGCDRPAASGPPSAEGEAMKKEMSQKYKAQYEQNVRPNQGGGGAIR